MSAYTDPVDEDLHDVDDAFELDNRLAEAADGAVQAVSIYGAEFHGDDYETYLALVKEGLE